jgi:hypothetical protein
LGQVHALGRNSADGTKATSEQIACSPTADPETGQHATCGAHARDFIGQKPRIVDVPNELREAIKIALHAARFLHGLLTSDAEHPESVT